MERFTLLTIAIFLFASITKAQITKGSTFIGGQVSASKSKSEGSSYPQESKSFYISPAVGTAINQNLIAGIDLSYGHTKNETGYSPTQKIDEYGGGVFLRKYAPILNRFFFFTQARAGYIHSKSESSSSNYNFTNEANGGSLSFYPGVSFALSKSLHIETGFNNLIVLGYTHGKSKQSGYPDQTSNSFNFSTSASGTNLSFALRFIIPKK